MRFSKLRLTGFKSFVDPTELLISDGLTGVVGPNGCGKSNLLEALRWVMGENRPKAMRGGGMNDVIFAGAATRPARNFAEVTLQLDNAERLAPAAFNEVDVLDVVRRITRDAGSAYKLSGKDVRARDVQMLFADASTGAHSPALVRQGQIAELINAKPKNRRRVLEEAAGISGLYQRRHEAELKLNAAENNLGRLDDVLEQLASQLAQLARQAKHAARYRAIAKDLRSAEGLLLFWRWKEADELCQSTAQALQAQKLAASKAEGMARSNGRLRSEAEEALPRVREEEAIAASMLQRLQVQRETLSAQESDALQKIETLGGRSLQLAQDITREEALNRDASEMIDRLEWETEELSKAALGQDDKLSTATQEAQDASAVLQERETDLSQLTEDVARLSARHQSAHRLLQDCEKTLQRSRDEAEKAKQALQHSEQQVVEAAEAFDVDESLAAQAQAQAEQCEQALERVETARSDTQAREAEARAQRSRAEGEHTALEAEMTALAKLLARGSQEGGQLLDRLQVEQGFEKALGAALADDLRAAEVEGEDALSGWRFLPDYPVAQPLPNGITPLSNHVSTPDALGRRMTQIGLVDGDEGARLQAALQPGQRLVSLEGDLWRWDGYCIWAEDAPSTAALHLEQVNRLEELKQKMAQTEAELHAARSAHDLLSGELTEWAGKDQRAREARRQADREVIEKNRALSNSEAQLNLAKGRVENLTLAVARHAEESLGAEAQRAEAQMAVDALEDIQSLKDRVEDIKLTVEAARITMLSKRSEQDELRRAGEARMRRKQQVTKELSGWRLRLETADQRRVELLERKSQTEADLAEAALVPDALARKREELRSAIAQAETRRKAAGDNLATGEAALRNAIAQERDSERAASEAREARAGAEARAEAAQETKTAAAQRIQDELQTTPQELLHSLSTDADRMPHADEIEAEVNRLKRQREALGAVNLRAEEDAKEVESEHKSLSEEKADLEAAIHTLRNGIAGLNREGRERLLTAFEQVNSNFGLLFKHLFGGGEANLVLVESDDPLEAGLEIMCQPPGKKLSTLSLLSGGEQTLTAMALIFAVFLANPAPICVLDEVDAPLDDANVTRFCDLLDEMCRRTDTRFLIITHHAVTMARMDRLFGVTMQEQGVSQLVSVDLKKAESLVA